MRSLVTGGGQAQPDQPGVGGRRVRPVDRHSAPPGASPRRRQHRPVTELRGHHTGTGTHVQDDTGTEYGPQPGVQARGHIGRQ
ncbi:MAG TPA: hypothetical protein VHV74_00800 [Pseudonocardiaceae bacterium]|nr:hypothetical protein [Pseudonocardiaceae bacterium]